MSLKNKLKCPTIFYVRSLIIRLSDQLRELKGQNNMSKYLRGI